MINRRDFIKTSAGFLALAAGPDWEIVNPASKPRSFDFKTYRPGKTLAPVTQVTPEDGYYIHSFYDTCPWSPDGKLLAVTKLPYQGKKPVRGDVAEVCVVDLEAQTIRSAYKTRCWSFQTGANAQWDAHSSRYLYTNDLIGDQAVAVRIDLETGQTKAFVGPKYDIAPNGKMIAGPNLDFVNITQYGYTLPDPPSGKPNQLRKDQMDLEGLWLTDLESDRKKLLVSLKNFYQHAVPEDQEFYKDGTYYCFHTKFNSQSNRIMQVFRCLFGGNGRHASLFTFNADGTNIIQCLPREKWNQKARLGGSGNHPNWHPDGEHIIMNTIPTWLGYQDMMFSMFRYDGSDFRVLTEKHLGSGHPSVDPTTRYLVADAYLKQQYVVKGDEIPIRLIDLKIDREYTLCTISNNVGNEGKMYDDQGGSQFKLDPHPVWSRDYRQLCINGAPKGDRQVFIVDLNEVV